jgi:HEPN domain-containing protein
MSDQTKYYLLMLELAEHDYIAMDKLKTPDVPEDMFGFHCQQAIEKTFKALLDFYGVKFPLTHELEDLYNLIVAKNADIKAFDELVYFTPYSVKVRYGELGFDEPLDRQKAMQDVRKLVDFVGKIVL